MINATHGLVTSGKILPFGSWVESHHTLKAKVRHSRERAFMLERQERELDLALLKDTYPREQAFDDGADTIVRPKKVSLTSAQFAEMSRLIKGARSQKDKDNIRRSYQYAGATGKADPIDTGPSIEASY